MIVWVSEDVCEQTFAQGAGFQGMFGISSVF